MTNPLALPGVDLLYRGDDDGLELRTADATGATLVGHFTKFNRWYEVDSWLEGRFLESVAPGAARKTIKENLSAVRVAFDHGYDPQIGDKPLGPIELLAEDDEGVAYEVPLLDTDYNRDFVLPALEGRLMDGRTVGSVLGASFRFRVTKDSWVMEPGRSTSNPDGIPERTISEFRLFEFGPVVYPASPHATAGVRSLTDHYFERALSRDGQRSQRAAGALAPVAAAASSTANGTTAEPSDHSSRAQSISRSRLILAQARSTSR